jgi:hypothetical protein
MPTIADGELPNPTQKYRLALFELNGAAILTEVAPVAAAAVVEPNATTNAANPVPPHGAREVVTIHPTQQHNHAITNELLGFRADVRSVKVELFSIIY